MRLSSCGSGNMGHARSPTHIFPSVSVGAQLGVVYVFVCVCLWVCRHLRYTRPCLLEPWKCNVWHCWNPGWQCIQQWKSEGLVLSPAYEGALPALKQPFICAQGLEMTMQPLLIAPDGAINKAMIHTGPVLTSFFTLQSLNPQGPPYLTPPLCSLPPSSSPSSS